MPSSDELESQVTLRTAVARFEELRARETFADPGDDEDIEGVVGGGPPALSRAEALELLALGEVIARKARYGRQLSVRTARRAGASWTQIGLALGTSKQTAWETHSRWIDQQAGDHGTIGHEGFDAADTARARALAGAPDQDSVDSGGQDPA